MNHHIQKDSHSAYMAELVSVEALRQDDAFNNRQWQRYVECEIGFILPSIQSNWLENAVTQTALAYGLTTAQLWQQLPHNNALRQQLLDKVLIHESRFFRHLPSIDFVTEYALQHQRQSLIDGGASSNNGNQDSNENNDIEPSEPFRIWSVGCATGQEVWSLAMSLASKQLSYYEILGTDMSEQALATARLGRYDAREQSLIPLSCQQFVQPLLPKTITKAVSIHGASTSKNVVNNSHADWQIMPTLKSQVRFALHNIMDKKPPTPYLQQVIVCQNMLLYFRKFDQRDILARLSEQCALGGYIILAPGEALFWRPSNMRRIAHPQINAWQKISA